MCVSLSWSQSAQISPQPMAAGSVMKGWWGTSCSDATVRVFTSKISLAQLQTDTGRQMATDSAAHRQRRWEQAIHFIAGIASPHRVGAARRWAVAMRVRGVWCRLFHYLRLCLIGRKRRGRRCLGHVCWVDC